MRSTVAACSSVWNDAAAAAAMTSESSERETDCSLTARTSLWVSIDSAAQVPAGARPRLVAARPARLAVVDRCRTAAQCAVVASLASFVIGVFMTTAGYGPVLSSPARRPRVIIVVLQVTLPTSTCFSHLSVYS